MAMGFGYPRRWRLIDWAGVRRAAAEALEAVSRMRPRAWPNLRILELGDALLGRNGEIVAAVAAIYRRVLDRDPSFQEAMIDGGRGREVIAALSAGR